MYIKDKIVETKCWNELQLLFSETKLFNMSKKFEESDDILDREDLEHFFPITSDITFLEYIGECSKYVEVL